MLPVPGQGQLFLLSLQNVFCCVQFEHRWQLKPLPMLQSLHVDDDQAQPGRCTGEGGGDRAGLERLGLTQRMFSNGSALSKGQVWGLQHSME